MPLTLGDRNSMKTCALTVVGMMLLMVQSDRFARIAEKLVDAINSDDQKTIQMLAAPVLQQALPEAKAREFFRDVIRQRGKIKKIGEPQLTGNTARIRLTGERGDWEMRLTLDDKDLINGLYIIPAEPEIAVPARNKTAMRLPFREEWSVFWGGATAEQNYHVNTRNQRRAVDLVIRDAEGKSHRGDGKVNEDYYCYGKEILAPADGTVITVIDGVPDNAPGSMNSYSAVGNCIIIEHAALEFSVLAHTQPYTIKVKRGDKVKLGQVLGKCGNSGNSSEPHLHFHLQNTAVLQDGTGFTPYFQQVRVTRDGKTTVEQEYTPVRGDRIRSQ